MPSGLARVASTLSTVNRRCLKRASSRRKQPLSTREFLTTHTQSLSTYHVSMLKHPGLQCDAELDYTKSPIWRLHDHGPSHLAVWKPNNNIVFIGIEVLTTSQIPTSCCRKRRSYLGRRWRDICSLVGLGRNSIETKTSQRRFSFRPLLLFFSFMYRVR